MIESQVIRECVMRYKILLLILIIFGILSYIDLSISYQGQFSLYKQLFLVLLLIVFLRTAKNVNTDYLMLLGNMFFVFSLSIFTLANLGNFNDIFTLIGYLVALAIFYFCSKSNVFVVYQVKKSLICLGFVFIVIAILSIGSESRISLGKGQYRGFFDNANAFAGLAGLFFVLFFCQAIQSKRKLATYIYSFCSLILLVFIFMAFSRGVILTIGLAVIFALFKFGKGFKLSLVIFTGLIVLYYIIFNDDQSLDLNRDIFEETGRLTIFQNYWKELHERTFFIGTGVSTEMGRIKSELSYFDIWLSSGIGVLGFLVYLFRSLYLSFKLKSFSTVWISSIFLYICFLSIFEGYIANIASLPSILFYILPGLIWLEYNNIYKTSNFH